MLLLNPSHAPASHEHSVLWGVGSRYYVPSFPGPLSIKSVLRGRAAWTTDEARHEVGRASYVVVNDAHPYTIEIDSEEPAETFCVFFARGFVEAAYRALVRPEIELLDDPERARPVSFPEVLQSRGAAVGAALSRLRDTLPGPSRGHAIDAEDGLVDLALALCEENQASLQRRARVETVKASTRDEIFRRLGVARDALESSLDEPLLLGDLARAAALSPFHLHRHFRRAFGETPQSYRRRLRLAGAARSLRGSEKPVTEVALEAGFSSLGSFSSLFKRQYGVSPGTYRLKKEQD